MEDDETLDATIAALILEGRRVVPRVQAAAFFFTHDEELRANHGRPIVRRREGHEDVQQEGERVPKRVKVDGRPRHARDHFVENELEKVVERGAEKGAPKLAPVCKRRGVLEVGEREGGVAR